MVTDIINNDNKIVFYPQKVTLFLGKNRKLQ